MTAGRSRGASPLLRVGLFAVAASVIAIAFASQDSTNIGGFADPQGTGPNGLLGLNTFIEEAGGRVEVDVGNPAADIDVAILATPVYNDVFAGATNDDDKTEQNYSPLFDWVEAGGTLVTSVDIPGGPLGGESFIEDDNVLVARGLCTLDVLAALSEVRPLAHVPVRAEPADELCFGEPGQAVVVVRRRGQGQIVRLASMGLFSNRALGDADNGALAARLLGLNDEPTVAFLSGPPATGPGDGGGPIDGEGNPVGVGEDTLFDLVPSRVIALLVGLGGAFLLYAFARGRRLGSPILEPVPIELPSSTYIDAVGRLFGRADDSTSRSASILRTDLRNDLARRVGMSANATATELAGALGSHGDNEAVVEMLDGRAPTTDAELVALATSLNDTRELIDRGGVTILLQSEGMTLAANEQMDTERNTDV